MAGSLPSIPFDYVTLADAAGVLGVAERQLIHAAGTGAVQLCVNIYARANGMSLSRIDDGDAGLSDEELAELSEGEQREREAHDAARAARLARCTTPMPHGVFEIDEEIARFFEMPETHSVNLYEAYKFDERGWWLVKFYDDETETGEVVEIKRSDMVVMREELARLLKPANSEPAQEKPLDERERTTLLCIIGALARVVKLDLSKPMKAGDAIAAMAAELKLSGRTIGEKLKLVGEAMERRTE